MSITITRQAVQSSNVKGVGYDAPSQTLEVEFQGGGVYRYFDVPADVYAAMLAAPSIGKFLNAHIKVYRCERQEAA